MAAYEVEVSAEFSATHAARLASGPLEEPHAHPWRVTAVYRAEALDKSGFVVDFLAVQGALASLAGELAGADLNQIVPPIGQGASAERVAEYLARRLAAALGREAFCVRVSEAPGCRAAYYPG